MPDRTVRWLWGGDVPASSFVVGAWAFRRALAAVYLIAFLSLLPQVTGLVGPDGILPVGEYLAAVERQTGGGAGAVWRTPTLAWLAEGELALRAMAAGGAGASVLLLAGVAPLWSAAAAWALYLSLTVAGQVFLSYQWDALLLEAGFLALFLCPAGRVRGDGRSAGPDADGSDPGADGRSLLPLSGRRPWFPAVWLGWWLLFRLTLESGLSKLAGGDPAWLGLTALVQHFETQPIPNPPAWFVHQLPEWTLRVGTAGALVMELAVPLLLLLPRRPRHLGAGLTILFQALIFATGNYTFFNLLTAGIALLCFDDLFWARLAGRLRAGRLRLARLAKGARAAVAGGSPEEGEPVAGADGGGPADPGERDAREIAERLRAAPAVPGRLRRWLAVPYAALVLVVGGAQLVRTALPGPLPGPVSAVARAVAPVRLVSGYGLFADMTVRRPEIVVEGRREGGPWRAYDFRYKPDRPGERPPQVAPHQPRLDWQMWFAALRAARAPEGAPPRARYDVWFLRFVAELLRGSPEVAGLLDPESPFRRRPPDAVRARLADYRFTGWSEWRATGRWWRRSPMEPYLPPVALGERGLRRAR